MIHRVHENVDKERILTSKNIPARLWCTNLGQTKSSRGTDRVLTTCSCFLDPFRMSLTVLTFCLISEKVGLPIQSCRANGEQTPKQVFGRKKKWSFHHPGRVLATRVTKLDLYTADWPCLAFFGLHNAPSLVVLVLKSSGFANWNHSASHTRDSSTASMWAPNQVSLEHCLNTSKV